MNKLKFALFLQKLKHQKKLIISAAAILIILLLIIFITLPSSNSLPAQVTPSNIQTDKPQSTDQNPPTNPQQTKQANPNLPKWNTYQGSTFKIQYPLDWSLQKGNIAGGGEVIIIRPNALPPELQYPLFILETEPMATTEIYLNLSPEDVIREFHTKW